MSCRAAALRSVLLAVVLVGTGCSRAEEGASYVDTANAICADVVDRFPEPRSVEPGSSAADRSFRELTTARGQAIEQLRALEPPREDRATVAKMLRQLAKSQRLLEEAERLGESEMVLPTLIAAAQEDDEAHAAARVVGLSDCARL